ncbi:LuxR C-terminal-related transcriptional regulator [Paenibacillaceae bacterium WGS1546]|uniref:LuxR C-terminal-related transcriptional regulator n=1 Tax=Cohnella sp. WGS1546 TaxID=3366810 RepID=UPI00372D5814
MSKDFQTRKTAGEIGRWERHYLVGRDREIQSYLDALSAHPPKERILNLYGTGGMGKSYLLDEFLRLAENGHAKCVLLDIHTCPRNPLEFCIRLLHLLHYPTRKIERNPHDIRSLSQTCIQEIEKAAAQGKLILALDTFEEIGDLEHWLRDELLAHLGPNVFTIISGRFPLQGAWQSSPAWRRLVLRMPVQELSAAAVKQYLRRSGIEQEETMLALWAKTKGHPLTLSLIVSTAQARTLPDIARTANEQIFPHVVKMWLKEAPDREIRELVEAAAVLRRFNQEMLSFVLEKHVPSEQFLKLTEHSFVRRVDRGWMLHDMLRDAIGHELRLRSPAYYDRLWKRCILHYYAQMKQSASKAAPWSADWIYYIGDRLIRTLFYQQSVPYYLEPLDPSNWSEAVRYIEHRRMNARDVRIASMDPETNERFEYVIEAEEGLSGFKHVHLQELYELDPGIVKLIRDTRREVCGMAIIVPIHEKTLIYLQAHPPSSAYFASLPEARLRELRTPRGAHTGYFIACIDVRDYANLSMRQAAGLTFIAHMLSAGLVVTTSPAIPFFHSIFRSLGFEELESVVHFDYDEQKPTPYFVLDTRGSRFQDYLDRMIASFGLSLEREAGDDPARLLSRRERDVAELLLEGRSNMEIAGHLYLSEATVKKHISNIFKKMKVKNRVQFLNLLRGNPPPKR